MALLRLPGLIDPHVHLRDPGQTEKEDFFTGTSAALAGGYTTIIDMPNNLTPITTRVALDEKMAIARKKIVADIGFYFGSVGDNLSEFKNVVEDVKGLKLYLNRTTGNYLIPKRALGHIYKAWHEVTSKPILTHAEGEMIEWILKEVRKTNHATHICHVSTKKDLEEILQAKNEGLPITCGVTPHHLFLTKEDEKALGPFGLMKPRLATQKDQNFLWDNLHSIDVVESDHAPHTIKEKESETSFYGIPGLETTLPLLLTAYNEGKISIEDIIRLCHDGPGRIFGIKKYPETLIEIDTKAEYILKGDRLNTKCAWSPFSGKRMKGKVSKVFIRGKKVFDNGRMLVKPGFGRLI